VLDIRQRLDIDTVQQPREFERLVGGDGIAVHHMQRIAGLVHVQPRQRAPSAADGVEDAVLAGLEHAQITERLADEFLGLLHRLRRNVGEREAAERTRHAVPHLRTAYVDQFERAAAKIADNAVGPVHAGNHAERGEIGLARAGQDLDVRADGRFGELDESRPVLGVAAGGCGDRERPLHPHGVAQCAKTLERSERVLHGVGGQQLGRLHLAAEAAQGLLVEDFSRTARQPLVDDEANGVRANIDHGDWRAVVEPSLRVGWIKFHRSQSARRPIRQAPGGAAAAARNPSAICRVLTGSDWS